MSLFFIEPQEELVITNGKAIEEISFLQVANDKEHFKSLHISSLLLSFVIIIKRKLIV